MHVDIILKASLDNVVISIVGLDIKTAAIVWSKVCQLYFIHSSYSLNNLQNLTLSLYLKLQL